MGLRSACLCCQRTTDAVRFICKNKGCLVVNYIDDFAGADGASTVYTSFDILGQVLALCGLAEAEAKSVPPNQVIDFLGVRFNTITMTLEVTPDRLVEILQLLSIWDGKVTATKQEIQSLIGKLVFVAACVRPGRLFISRMLNFLRTLADGINMELPFEFYKDVYWWKTFLPTFNGVSMLYLEEFDKPDFFASSDACLTGCGGWCRTQFFHQKFPSFIMEQNLHINALELLSIVICAKLWCDQWSGKRIILYCDNTASVTVLNSGRTHDRFLQKCLREISFLAAGHEFQVRAAHIAGKENRLADYLSRWSHNGNDQRFHFLTAGWKDKTDCKILDALFLFSHDW